MTKRFEYPSESSFLEEDSTQVSNDTQSETSSLTPLGIFLIFYRLEQLINLKGGPETHTVPKKEKNTGYIS